MDLDTFKQRLGADPHDRSPDMQEALAQGEAFQQAAAEAEALESRLHASLMVDAPHDLALRLRGIAAADEPARGDADLHPWRSKIFPLGLAFSVLVAFGAVMLWQQQRYSDLQSYVATHYGHDGARLEVMAETEPVDAQQIQAIMASVDASVSPGLQSQVRFIKNCPTPDGKGAHMVLSTPDGLVSVIYMPHTHQGRLSTNAIEGKTTQLVQMQRGQAAIIGDDGATVSQVASEILEGLTETALET